MTEGKLAKDKVFEAVQKIVKDRMAVLAVANLGEALQDLDSGDISVHLMALLDDLRGVKSATQFDQILDELIVTIILFKKLKPSLSSDPPSGSAGYFEVWNKP